MVWDAQSRGSSHRDLKSVYPALATQVRAPLTLARPFKYRPSDLRCRYVRIHPYTRRLDRREPGAGAPDSTFA